MLHFSRLDGDDRTEAVVVLDAGVEDRAMNPVFNNDDFCAIRPVYDEMIGAKQLRSALPGEYIIQRQDMPRYFEVVFAR